MKLKIKTHEKSPGNVQIALTGRLDTETYPQLQEVVDGIFSGAPRLINFDLEHLDYLSSMGLRVVMQVMKRLKASKGEVVLSNPKPHIQKVFDIAKVLPSHSIFASVAEADAYYDTIQRRVLEEGTSS